MAKELGALLISLGLNLSGFNKGMKKVETSLKGVDKQTQKFSASAKAGFTLLGTAAIAGFGMAIKKGIAFENQMTRVKAVTKGTEDQFKQLQTMAFKLSSATGISATKVAESMEKLARFGFDAQKIIKTLPSILNGVRASGEGVDTVLRVTEGLLSEFGLSADKTAMVVDTLTAVSMKTRANFTRMGEAFKYSAGTAKQAGVKMHDLAAVTGLLINAGVEGGMAGRAMRRVMLRLASPTGAAAKEMKKLGVNVDDGKGKMKTMTRIIGDLVDKTKGLTQLKKIELLNKMFGTEGITPILALMEQGPEKIKKLADEIEKSGGITSEVSKKMADSAEQSLNRFKTSLDNLQIQLVIKLLPALTKIVDKLTEWIKAYDDLDEGTKDFITTTALIVGGLLAVGGAVAILTPAIRGLTLLARGIGLAFAFLGTPLGVAVALIGALIFALDALGVTWEDVVKVLSDGWARIKKDVTDVISYWNFKIGQFSNWLTNKIMSIINKASSWGKDMIENFGNGISEGWGWVKKKLSGITKWISNNFGFSVPKDGPLSNADKWMPDMMKLFSQGIESGIPKIKAALGDVSATIASDSMGGMPSPTTNNTYNTNVSMQSAGFSSDQLARSINRHWMMNGVYS